MTHEQLSAIETRIEKLKEARWESVVSLASTIAHDDAPALLAEVWRIRAELEAAKGDIRALSDEYKFCNMCKYHNGEGVDTCSHPLRFSCDAKNFYEWRGATENGGANGRAD